MAVPPTEAAVPGVLEPAAVATGSGAGRFGRLRAIGGIWIPAFLVAAILFLCFVWPIIGPVPSPTGGSILNSSLPSFSPGHLFGTDRTATTNGRAFSMAGAPRSRCRWP